jgi:methylated-DNA-[protein]-cysteine S-methyltransferase
MKIEKLMESAAAEFKNEGLETLLRHARAGLEKELKYERRPEAAVGVAESPLGDLLVALTGEGIALVHYLADARDLASTIGKVRPDLDLVEDLRAVESVGGEIRRYLAGDANALRQKVDLRLATTPFQQKVLGKLQEIPRGAVISYQALGAEAGAPRGARAVGNAMHDNPVPIYVPCHRVIASGGGLGGYGGGPGRKLQLLRSEGFALGDHDRKLPADAVWGHLGTRIFCRDQCPTATRVDRGRILFFAKPRDAKDAGFRPCKICRPE